VLELAASQHGLVSGWQLKELGISKHQKRRLRESPSWSEVAPSVFSHASAGTCTEQQVATAVLAQGRGALLSHESAAAWWGHRGCRLMGPIQVTSLSRMKPKVCGVQTFHVERIDTRWVTRHRGVAVARPELVAMQLFAVLSYGRASRIVDRLWSMRLLTGRSLALLLTDLGRRGRNGIAALRIFVDDRGLDYEPPDSGLESRVEQILARAGINVRRQVHLGSEHAWNGRVDFLHETLPIVIEVQSEAFHSSLTDSEADRARIQGLEAAGFRVVEITDDQAFTDPRSVVEAVQAEISGHGRQIGDHGR
jgi:very-short-patch-repair endonuclease